MTTLRNFSAVHWSALALACALLSHLPALPWPALGALALALATRRLPPGHKAAVVRLLLLTTVALVVVPAWGWSDSATLRTVLLTVLALKWAESRSDAEFSLVGSAATLASALGLLQWGEGAALAWAAGATLLLLGAQVPTLTSLPRFGATLARHLVQALPLAAVLFVFFPRIPGPLWDIGLSFGLPLPVSLEKSHQGLGVAATLRPGQTQTGASDGEPVLVAEFRNWVPPTSMLYWRGPVFYDFDGQDWQLDSELAQGNGRQRMAQGWRKGSDFVHTLGKTSQEIAYQVRLTPHQALWLYGLDVPTRLTSESFISRDWQVLAHTPVTQEMHYDLQSALEWEDASPLDAGLRARALALPAHSNPRLQALGQQWLQSGEPPARRVERSLQALAQGGYQVRTRFTAPQGADALDQFWFDTREGNGEFFAAAYVVLMRSAGIPARLVTGYRGGKLMALTDYVVVKRSHAHAWAEIWREDKGWTRIDPTDIVHPDTAARPSTQSPRPQPTPAAPSAPAQDTAATQAPAALPTAPATRQALARRNVDAAGWQLPDVTEWLMRWVFQLDAQQQQALLPDGTRGSAWLWLLLAGCAGAAGVLLLGAGWQRWRAAQRQPAPARAWQRALRQLAQAGWPAQAHECPERYAQRVAADQPACSVALTQLAQAYAQWRYGPQPDQHAARVVATARLLSNHLLSQPARKKT